VKRIVVPWARKGSKFTLLDEQATMLLVQEMPVLTTARILEMSDKKLWRIVQHYVRVQGCNMFSLRRRSFMQEICVGVVGAYSDTLFSLFASGLRQDVSRISLRSK